MSKQEGITTIRVNRTTKEALDAVKIIDRETYDSVISRALEYMLEDKLELNEVTKDILKQRIEEVNKGEVVSAEELLNRLQKRRGKKSGK